MNHISINGWSSASDLPPEATPFVRYTTSSSNGHPAGGTDLGLRNPLLRASGSVVVEPGGQPGGFRSSKGMVFGRWSKWRLVLHDSNRDILVEMIIIIRWLASPIWSEAQFDDMQLAMQVLLRNDFVVWPCHFLWAPPKTNGWNLKQNQAEMKRKITLPNLPSRELTYVPSWQKETKKSCNICPHLSERWIFLRQFLQ